MSGSSNLIPRHAGSAAAAAMLQVPQARRYTPGRHSEAVARGGGREIDPLAVLRAIMATLKEYRDAEFDATTFVSAYGRARGRAVLVEEASLSRRGLVAETWVCETYDLIRVDRAVPARQRTMVILVQWASIHYQVESPGQAHVESFEILAEAVANHRALPIQWTRVPLAG